MQRVNILVTDVDSCGLVTLSFKGGVKPDIVSSFIVKEAEKGELIDRQSYKASYLCTHRSVQATRGGARFKSIIAESINLIENSVEYVKKYPDEQKNYPDYSDFDRDEVFLSRFESRFRHDTKLPLLAVSTPEDDKIYGEEECGGVYTQFIKPIEETILKTKETKQSEKTIRTSYNFEVLPDSIGGVRNLPIEKSTNFQKNRQYMQIIQHAVKHFPGKALHFIILDDRREILENGLKILLDDLSLPQVPITLMFYQHDAFLLYADSIKNKPLQAAFVLVGIKQNELAKKQNINISEMLTPIKIEQHQNEKSNEHIKYDISSGSSLLESKISTKAPMKPETLSDFYGLDEDAPNEEILQLCIDELSKAVIQKKNIKNTDEFKKTLTMILAHNRDEFKKDFDDMHFETLKSLLLSHIVETETSEPQSSLFISIKLLSIQKDFKHELRKRFLKYEKEI